MDYGLLQIFHKITDKLGARAGLVVLALLLACLALAWLAKYFLEDRRKRIDAAHALRAQQASLEVEMRRREIELRDREMASMREERAREHADYKTLLTNHIQHLDAAQRSFVDSLGQLVVRMESFTEHQKLAGQQMTDLAVESREAHGEAAKTLSHIQGLIERS